MFVRSIAGALRRLNILYASVALGGGTSSIRNIAKQCATSLPKHPLTDPGFFDVTWKCGNESYELRLLQDFRDNLGIGLASASVEYAWVRREYDLYEPGPRWNLVARGLQHVARFLPSVDGIVLVVDSQQERLEAVRERVETLEVELVHVGRDPMMMPVLFQLNKRDLLNAASIRDLRVATRWPGPSGHVESIASRGERVAEALDGLLDLISRVVS